MQPLSSSLILSVLLGSILTADAFAQRGRFTPYRGPGTVTRIEWGENGKILKFSNQGQRYELDLTTMERTKLGADESRRNIRNAASGRGARGRNRNRGSSVVASLSLIQPSAAT